MLMEQQMSALAFIVTEKPDMIRSVQSVLRPSGYSVILTRSKGEASLLLKKLNINSLDVRVSDALDIIRSVREECTQGDTVVLIPDYEHYE